MTLKDLDSLLTKKQVKIFSFMSLKFKSVELKEGDTVEYEEAEGRKGLIAANVQLL